MGHSYHVKEYGERCRICSDVTAQHIYGTVVQWIYSTASTAVSRGTAGAKSLLSILGHHSAQFE
eukprot:1184994-Prorocentrum_minimum.AAC.3